MDNEDKIAAALGEGRLLVIRQSKKAREVREESKKVCGKLADAHLLAISVIANAISKVSGKPGKSDPDLAHMLSLSASFIQGIDLCEGAISEGIYVSAAALLKQEMETIAAIKEVRANNRKSGKTPNVKSFGELAVLYGDLNDLAHVGDAQLMQRVVRIELSAEQSGAPLFPVFIPDLAKLFYGLHVCFVTMIAIEVEGVLTALYGQGFERFETDMLVSAANILREFGWIPDAQSQR